MPTYEYRCQDCGHQFDIIQKFSDDPLTVCPVCGGHIRRVVQRPGVVFKGSGFYITDSRATPKADSGSASGESEKSSGAATTGSNDAAAPTGPSEPSAKPATSNKSDAKAPAAADA